MIANAKQVSWQLCLRLFASVMLLQLALPASAAPNIDRAGTSSHSLESADRYSRGAAVDFGGGVTLQGLPRHLAALRCDPSLFTNSVYELDGADDISAADQRSIQLAGIHAKPRVDLSAPFTACCRVCPAIRAPPFTSG
mgnify:CR=1 FL=1